MKLLIDKEKLMNHIKGFLGIKSPSRVFMEKLDSEWDDVENAPTVEAIPIEYLCKELKQCKASTVVEVGAIIDKWVKENETN